MDAMAKYAHLVPLLGLEEFKHNSMKMFKSKMRFSTNHPFKTSSL
jgi:hypothetical protein